MGGNLVRLWGPDLDYHWDYHWVSCLDLRLDRLLDSCWD